MAFHALMTEGKKKKQPEKKGTTGKGRRGGRL
jgi:hypothetical protein